MSNVALEGSTGIHLGTGYTGYINSANQNKVADNGVLVACSGAGYLCSSHGQQYITKSGRFCIEGNAIILIGDLTTCSAIITSGSEKVNVTE